MAIAGGDGCLKPFINPLTESAMKAEQQGDVANRKQRRSAAAPRLSGRP